MSSTNIKLNLLIVSIVIFGIGLSGLFIWATIEWKEIFIFSILISLMLYFFTYKIKSKYVIIRAFCYIASLPIKILAEWFRYMQPSLTIVLSYLIIALYAFGIPFLLSKGLSFLFQWHLTIETIIFLTLSIGSIVSVHCNFIIHWIIKEWSPLKDWGNHKYEAVRTDLSLYVTSKNNIHFLISLAYVVFLIYTSFIHIQYNDVWISIGIDASIQKAFIVFIAFSTMMTKRKNVEITPQSLYDKIKELFKMEHK
ncbi:MAG: hypothetical protein IJB61_06745 [Bacteroides sp]|nr:hypothetical protein [Bacteroides sp.]